MYNPTEPSVSAPSVQVPHSLSGGCTTSQPAPTYTTTSSFLPHQRTLGNFGQALYTRTTVGLPPAALFSHTHHSRPHLPPSHVLPSWTSVPGGAPYLGTYSQGYRGPKPVPEQEWQQREGPYTFPVMPGGAGDRPPRPTPTSQLEIRSGTVPSQFGKLHQAKGNSRATPYPIAFKNATEPDQKQADISDLQSEITKIKAINIKLAKALTSAQEEIASLKKKNSILAQQLKTIQLENKT